MGLKALLERHKSAIVKRWFESVTATYAPDTSAFLKNQKDPFNNPVGNTFSKGLAEIYDNLLSGLNPEVVMPFLDSMVRIRAVQRFNPSQAVDFVLKLKRVVRETLRKEIAKSQMDRELTEFDETVDALMLMAFDLYMKCKEDIYNLKANHEKTKIYSAFKRAGLIAEIPDDEPEATATDIY